jgi:hypothetical protein
MDPRPHLLENMSRAARWAVYARFTADIPADVSVSSALPANLCPFRPSAVKWLRAATDLIVRSVRPQIKRFLSDQKQDVHE